MVPKILWRLRTTTIILEVPHYLPLTKQFWPPHATKKNKQPIKNNNKPNKKPFVSKPAQSIHLLFHQESKTFQILKIVIINLPILKTLSTNTDTKPQMNYIKKIDILSNTSYVYHKTKLINKKKVIPQCKHRQELLNIFDISPSLSRKDYIGSSSRWPTIVCQQLLIYSAKHNPSSPQYKYPFIFVAQPRPELLPS